jgi:hypothetical protein
MLGRALGLDMLKWIVYMGKGAKTIDIVWMVRDGVSLRKGAKG